MTHPANSKGAQPSEDFAVLEKHVHFQGSLLVLLTAGLIASLLTGCTNSSNAREPVAVQAITTLPTRPVQLRANHRIDPNSPTSTTQTAAKSATEVHTPAHNTTTDGFGASSGTTRHSSAEPLAERLLVANALQKYSKLVTDIAAHPDTASDPQSPLRAQWDALVPALSPLSVDVLNQLVVIPATDHTRVIPNATGLSYSYRAVTVAPQAQGLISFSWCGYSPGIRVADSSGEVVDEAVAEMHGTGSIREVGASWVVDSLDHLDLVVLPAGSPDPCPPSTHPESP
ncbi:MAG: hypothetical protein WCJ04_07870 [Actinomycetes bacterium]